MIIPALYEHLRQLYNETDWNLSGETIGCKQKHRVITIRTENEIQVIIKLVVVIPRKTYHLVMSEEGEDYDYYDSTDEEDYIELQKMVDLLEPKSIDRIERIILYMLTEHDDPYEICVPI